MRKELKLGLMALLILITAGVVHAGLVEMQQSTSTPLLKGDETFDYLIKDASRVFQITIHSPYDTILGYTWYDYQHNSRMPRMIANDYQTSPGQHFTFMELAEDEFAWVRAVDYNYRDAQGWAAIPPPSARITEAAAAGGYTGLDLIRPLDGNAHSRAVVCYHRNAATYPNPEPCWTTLSIEPDSAGEIAMEDGRYWYDIPDYGGTDDHGVWPACSIDSLNRIHVVNRAGESEIGWLGYVRCEEREGDTLMCWAPGKDSVLLAKETFYTDQDYQVALFGYSENVSPTVAASKVSNKVAVFWSSAAESETDSALHQVSNDIYYIESETGGDDWFVAGSMPSAINITKYDSGDYMRAYGDICGVYDLNDSLHIFWHTHYYDQAAGYFDFNNVGLWHWSKATQRICDGDTIGNKVTSATWEAYPGRWNRLLSKMQAGVGIVDSTADPDHYNWNYLYLQWTQFDSGKISRGDYTQGDLYLTLSTDFGFTWHTPVNVTNSTVPDCEIGNCASDHWSSMAERVDTAVYMQWIYDLDPGGMTFGEGYPTDNPVLFRAFPTDSIPLDELARISWNPGSFAPPPMRLQVGSDTTLYLTIGNTGTAALQEISLSSDAEGDWLTIGSCPTSMLAGACPAIVTLSITGGSQETYLIDSVRIQSNDQVGNHDVYVRLQVIVSDVYKVRECAIVDNPTFRLLVSNTGNLADRNDTAGFYLVRDGNHPNFLYDGSAVIGFISPEKDTLVGRDCFEEHYFLPATDLAVDTFPELKTVVTETEFWPVRIEIPPADQYWPWWRINLKGYIFFSDDRLSGESMPENKNEQFVALEIITLSHDQPPDWWPDVSPPENIPDTYLGMALDVDSPSDTGAYNIPACDEFRRLVYLGGYGIGVEENYRMGVAQKDSCYRGSDEILCCWPSEDDPSSPPRVEPYSMHILRNDAFIYPQDCFRDDSLYKYMSIPGYSVYGEGIREDYSILATGAKINAHGYPDSSAYTVAYALVISDEWGDSTLNHRVDMIACGNVDRDLTVGITDVVYYINWVFKGGRQIWRYMGDVDGNGIADLADIVYLTNYLLRGGPAPQCSGL